MISFKRVLEKAKPVAESTSWVAGVGCGMLTTKGHERSFQDEGDTPHFDYGAGDMKYFLRILLCVNFTSVKLLNIGV